MNQFIPRIYGKENDSFFYTFDELINKSQISIILGEPASGKTFQLEYFNKITNDTRFVELMFIEDEEDIVNSTKYILMDSIDEALSKNDSDKTTIRNLLKYITKSLEINPSVKFIITCRYLEWKEIFEEKLKEIDKDIQIYHIQELSKDDINKLLTEKNIEEKDFWDFISQNFLDELLKNVLMIINIIDNFQTYKSKSLKYFEIYDEIIQEHLFAKTANERSKQLSKTSFEDMKLISSSLAIYFTLNHNRVIDASDLDRLASELYKIDNVEYNKELLEFILKNDMLNFNKDTIYIHVFQILYKQLEFKKLFILLQNFSLYTDKKVIENIDIKDLIFWFDNISSNYKEKYERYRKSKQINFLIFLLLKHFEKSKDAKVLEKVFSFLDNQYIYCCDFYIGDYEKDKYILEFNSIADYFWKYFFSLKDIYKSAISRILDFYKKPIKGLDKIIDMYPVIDYKDHYLHLRRYSNLIGNFEKLVLENSDFKDYLKKEFEKLTKQKWYKDEEKSKIKLKKQEEKDELNYQKAISSLSTFADIYNIYYYADRKTKEKKDLNETIKNDLGEEKYQIFMDFIKDGFINDILYLEIKKDLLKDSIYYWTIIFHFYFKNISEEDIDSLIKTEDDYKKLYYQVYYYRKLASEYFVHISKRFISTLIDLSIETFKISKNRVSDFVYLFNKINIYNSNYLKPLIVYIKLFNADIWINLEKYNKESFLSILALEKENYDFIKGLYFIDCLNEYSYFKSLCYIDINRAFDDYLNMIYSKGNKYLNLCIDGKINFVRKNIELNKYDNILINPIYRKKFKTLLALLYSLKENRNFENINVLNNKNLKFILVNYYDFFKEYHHPTGSYSPDIYDNMNDLINFILNYIGSSDSYIPLLEDLQNTENKNLKATVKYQLEKAYNYKQKNRVYTNKHYKDIFDNYSFTSNVFFDYEKLEKDLIDISLTLMKSRKRIFEEIEDLINDRYRDALKFKGYIINDQTRAGESGSGKSVGEIDLEVKNKDTNITEALIEAFILESDNTKVIEEHYEKLIKKYDTSGNENNFVLIYVKYSKFESLWEKYKLHFKETEEIDTQKENIKVIYTKYNNMKISHIFINYYSI